MEISTTSTRLRDARIWTWNIHTVAGEGCDQSGLVAKTGETESVPSSQHPQEAKCFNKGRGWCCKLFCTHMCVNHTETVCKHVAQKGEKNTGDKINMKQTQFLHYTVNTKCIIITISSVPLHTHQSISLVSENISITKVKSLD